jgi:hypothetical protein
MVKKGFESTPLYRLFNVLIFLGYSLVVIAMIIAGFIGFEEREIAKATVKCNDGTSWNAKNIAYNSYALCGICKNRTVDGKNYQECTYKDMDYSSYNLDIVKEWTWKTIIYPLIAFIIGFGMIDSLKLFVIYVI